jgi:hypothetical protein
VAFGVFSTIHLIEHFTDVTPATKLIHDVAIVNGSSLPGDFGETSTGQRNVLLE